MTKIYHVLYIDDDTYIRQIVRHTMGDDFNVTMFSNAVEAFDWLEQGNFPDIILTDLHMPDLDGLEFINLVKNSSLYRIIPIYVLSASTDSELKIKCLNQGADDFISKPFNPLFVKAKIEALMRLLDQRRIVRSGLAHERTEIR
ncbi:MAG: response regulator [Cytophagaceae bacterium]|nr:MAG: response regulator [Cytophagaceae bacterium]